MSVLKMFTFFIQVYGFWEKYKMYDCSIIVRWNILGTFIYNKHIIEQNIVNVIALVIGIKLQYE